jgi:outer membrane protease
MIVIAALLCLAASPAQADGAAPPITFRTGVRFGAFYGQANEIVYNQALSAGYKNSELVWPLQPMLFSGAALSIDSAPGIFATLDVRQGFAGKVGTMTDSDFLNGDGQRTHFSQSDSYAERANLLDLKVGWDFFRRGALSIGAFGAFSYMDLKWSARDGYYQYPTSGSPYTMSPFAPGTYAPWSPGETKTPLYGTGIIYETAYFGGAVGIRARYEFLGGFSVDASFAFTPLLGCSAEDNHVFRQIDFYSTLSGGFMIEPRVAIEYSPLPRATLRLEIGYRYSWGLKGDLTEVNNGSTNVSSGNPYYAGPDSAFTGANDSGASLSVLDASLVLSFSL